MTQPTIGMTKMGLDGVLSALTTTEAARRMRLSVSTVRVMVERGELTAWTTQGGHRRICSVSVQRWLASRAMTRVSEAGLEKVSEQLSEASCSRILIAGPRCETADCHQRLASALPDAVHCEFAEDAFEVLLMTGLQCPDLLILCSGLQPIDGLALVRRLRLHAAFRRLPAVVLRSTGDGASRVAADTRPPGIVVWESPLPIERMRGLVDAQRFLARACHS